MALFDYMIAGLINTFGNTIIVAILLLIVFGILLFVGRVGLGAVLLFLLFSVFLLSTVTIGGNSVLPQAINVIPQSVGLGVVVLLGLLIALMFYTLFLRD